MTIHSDLADRYAAKKIALEALNAEVEALKKEINETGADEIHGSKFLIKVTLAERTTVSATEAKKFVSVEVFNQIAKTSTYPTIRYKAISAE